MNIPESLKEAVTDTDPELEHRKAADFYASWSLTVTQEEADERSGYGDSSWLPFVGYNIQANGIWNDNWGSEVYDWAVYQPHEKQSEASADFWELMSHLNSEDNELARKFADKHLPVTVEFTKVKEVPSEEAIHPAATK